MRGAIASWRIAPTGSGCGADAIRYAVAPYAAGMNKAALILEAKTVQFHVLACASLMVNRGLIGQFLAGRLNRFPTVDDCISLTGLVFF